jgi:hypothetical protein
MKKQLLTLLTGLLLAGSLAAQVTDDKLSRYCNARFSYCLNYPTTLMYQGEESANGDGLVFTNTAGAEVLRVFGRLNQDANGNTISLEKQFRTELNKKGKDRKVTYKKLGKDFFAVSGYENGMIFYTKVIQLDKAFGFAMMRYKPEEKALYEQSGVLEQVFSSFR